MHDLRLVWQFAFHTVAALGLFAIVAGAAALLSLYTKLLGGMGLSPLILQAIHATEYFLFGIDLLCFLVYCLRETWLLLRKMFAKHVDGTAEL